LSTARYRDPNASVQERVEDLLALMTLDEKLAQLSCLWSTAFVSTGAFDPDSVAKLMPHGIGQVTFTVHPSRLAFYDPSMRFVTEPGAFTFSVGASSADIRAEQTVTLGGQIAEFRQREIVSTQVGIA
jgi:fibronectin type III domain protein